MDWVENSSGEWALGAASQAWSQQQALAGKMANSIWASSSRTTTTRRSKKIFRHLYPALTHTMSSLGPPTQERHQCAVVSSVEKYQDDQDGIVSPRGKARRVRFVQPGAGIALGHLTDTPQCGEGALRTQLHSSQWFIVTGWKTTGIYWNKRGSGWMREETFFEEQSSTETHCLEKSYWFHPWMFSEPNWIKLSRSGLNMLLAGGWIQPELPMLLMKRI